MLSSSSRRLVLVLATVAAVAGPAVPAMAGSAPTGTPTAQSTPPERGAPMSAAAQLTPDARALGPDPDSALRAYWSESRREAAIEVDVPELTEEEVARGVPEPVGEPGKIAPRPGPPRGPRTAAGNATAGFGDMGSPWPWRGDEPATTVGKVFFYDVKTQKTYKCSATVLDSEGNNLVWTAGHCVHGGKGGTWHQNWIFYPHYRNGPDPAYGTWRSAQLWSWTKWMNESNFSYDYGAALMAPNASGQRIAQFTGGQGLAWNQPKKGYVHSFGYPGEWPFNGLTLQYCHGETWASGADLGMKCNMTGGSSGGPWIGWFDGWAGWVNGHNSYKITWDPTRMFSPYYGNAVGTLYNALRWG